MSFLLVISFDLRTHKENVIGGGWVGAAVIVHITVFAQRSGQGMHYSSTFTINAMRLIAVVGFHRRPLPLF
jgi:hypothetical protein